MGDQYARMYDKAESPARSALAITPADTPLADITKAVYVGGVGNLTLIAVDDKDAVTFVAVPTGTIIWVRARQINSTGTTATNIVGLY